MADVAVKIKFPDRIEKEARKAGLLSSAFFRGAVQRELERRAAAGRLEAHAAKFKAAGIPPLTDEEVDAEVDAVRAARRGKRASRR